MRRSLLIAAAALVCLGTQAAPWSEDAGTTDTATAARSVPGSPAAAHLDRARDSYDTAVTDLLLAENRLASADQALEHAQADLDRVQSALDEADRTTIRAARDLALAEARLAGRLRAIYTSRGSMGLELLFGSTSIRDLVERATLLGRLAAGDRELTAQVGQKRDRAAATATALDSAREERRREMAALADARDRLRTVKDQKARLVTRLGNRLVQVENAAREAARKMADLNRKAAGTSTDPPSDGASGGRTPGAGGTTATTAAGAATTAPPAAPPATNDASRGGYTLKVKTTAYSGPGTTATGVPVGPGIIAVDPRVIPLGTRLYVPGYGEGIAADTGGAVKGAFIDVWLPTEAEAEAWGVKYLTITVYE
ncbi:MAG: 3D domain-containing protein [Thermoleophilia bacterium]|nr:3D domain-containing protein [Thermoleophilia bacterium]